MKNSLLFITAVIVVVFSFALLAELSVHRLQNYVVSNIEINIEGITDGWY